MTLNATLVDIVRHRSAAQHAEAEHFRDGATFASEAAWSLIYAKPVFVGVDAATSAKEPDR